MEIAILVVFLAIFSGLFFLAVLIWFFVRRRRKTNFQKRNFASRAGSSLETESSDDFETDYDSASTGSYFDNSNLSGNYSDSTDAVCESAKQSETVQAQIEHHGSHAAAPDYGYSESNSNYDSGSSYDSSSYESSSSNSDSSSSSDSGSSWSND